MMKAKYFIGTLVIMGLLVLCLSMVVQGAITFPAAAAAPPYAITVTGNYGSAFLKNVAFEENRTLSPLYSSPILNAGAVGTTKDFVSPVRVTDRKGVYGSQFTCFLYAPVTFTSCVLTFPVTYFDGTTGTIAKTFTGVGTQNIGGSGVVIKDCRSVTITALVGTSFRIKVNQSFYGIMWNITRLTDKIDYSLLGYFYNESFTEHDYYMEGSTFTLGVNTGGVGSNMTVENSRLIFFDNPFIRLDSVEPSLIFGTLFTCRRNVRLSILNSTVEVQPTAWCNPPTNFISFPSAGNNNRVKIEKSRLVTRVHPLYGFYSGAGLSGGSYSTTLSPWDINNTFFDGVFFSYCNLRNFKNNIICNVPQKVFYMCSIGDVSNIQIINCRDGFTFFQVGFNLTTINFDLYRYLCEFVGSDLGTAQSVHLIDCISNNYVINRVPYVNQFLFWDKTVKIKVQNNSVNLSGVTVRFYNKTGVLKSTQTTNSNGNIPSTILSALRWEKDFGINPVYDVPYNITFSKTGYQDTWITDYLNLPLNLTVPMKANYTSGLVISDNSVDCTGTIEYSFNPNTGLYGEWWVWVNKTGAGGGASSGLQVINPNPGNGTCLGYNYLQANTLGTKTCVDVSYQNFTNLTVDHLGNGTLIEYYNTGDDVNKTKYVEYDPNGIGQGFTIGNTGENKTCIPTKVRLKIWRNAGNTKPLNVEIRDYPYYPDIGIITDPLTQIYTIIANGSIPYTMIPTVSPGSWVTINLTAHGILLESGHFYVLWLDPESTSYMVGHITHYYQTYIRAKTIGAYTGGHGIEECYLPSPMHWTEYNYDYLFEVYGWTFGGNITWNQTLNLTWSSNSSGPWQQYGATQTIYQNGTYCVLNTNMTVNDTQYWWRVNYTNPVESGYHVYTFTTADRKQIIPIGSSSGSSIAMGMSMGGCVGILGGLCVGLVVVRRRKRQPG